MSSFILFFKVSTHKGCHMIFVFLCWLALLSIILSRSIHIDTNSIISLFSYSWVIFHWEYTPCLYSFLYEEQLDCVYVLAIIKSSSMNNEVHVSFQIRVFSGYMSRSGITGSNTLFLAFKGTSIQSSIVVAPIYIPTKGVGGFPYIHTLSRIYYM